MDFKKFAAEASTVFSRAKQFTEEKLGTTNEKTELDAHFENLILRADNTKEWTEKILKGTESVIQPNPSVRMEEYLYGKLEKKKRDRQTTTEELGLCMVDAGNNFGPGTAYGSALVKCGQTELKLGQAEKDFTSSTATNFLIPLKNFLEGDMKTIQKERRILELKRLDLDAAKSRLRKARSPTSQAQSPNGTLQESIQEQKDLVAQAEQDLRIAQSEFDRQSEITKLLLEGISSTHAHHLKCLNDFAEAQMTYYAQCQQYMADLQRQLTGYSGMEPTPNLPGQSPPAYSHHGPGTNMPQYRPPTSGVTYPSAPPMQTATASSAPKYGARRAKVLYDYEAADKTELSLMADEIIEVWALPEVDPDWLMGERGNIQGKVPITYIDYM